MSGSNDRNPCRELTDNFDWSGLEMKMAQYGFSLKEFLPNYWIRETDYHLVKDALEHPMNDGEEIRFTTHHHTPWAGILAVAVEGTFTIEVVKSGACPDCLKSPGKYIGFSSVEVCTRCKGTAAIDEVRYKSGPHPNEIIFDPAKIKKMIESPFVSGNGRQPEDRMHRGKVAHEHALKHRTTDERLKDAIESKGQDLDNNAKIMRDELAGKFGLDNFRRFYGGDLPSLKKINDGPIGPGPDDPGPQGVAGPVGERQSIKVMTTKPPELVRHREMNTMVQGPGEVQTPLGILQMAHGGRAPAYMADRPMNMTFLTTADGVFADFETHGLNYGLNTPLNDRLTEQAKIRIKATDESHPNLLKHQVDDMVLLSLQQVFDEWRCGGDLPDLKGIIASARLQMSVAALTDSVKRLRRKH